MNETQIIDVGRETLVVILEVSGPVLLAALLVGLLIALFQALTQMQEMTLAFVPKIFAVIFAVMVLAPFMVNSLQGFMHHIADMIVGLGT